MADTNATSQTSAGEGVNTDGAAGAQPGSAQAGTTAASGTVTMGSVTPSTGEAKFTQADLDRIVRDRLAEETRKGEAKAKKEREAAEAAQLADQQKWQELAGKHEAKVKELEPLAERVAKLTTALEKLLVKEREGLPKHVTTLLDKLDPAEQLEYIAANREALGVRTTPTAPNVNATAGNGSQALDPKAEEARLRAQYRI
jgi:hypothetical protein